MTKAELVEEVATETGVSKNHTALIVDGVFDAYLAARDDVGVQPRRGEIEIVSRTAADDGGGAASDSCGVSPPAATPNIRIHQNHAGVVVHIDACRSRGVNSVVEHSPDVAA